MINFRFCFVGIYPLGYISKDFDGEFDSQLFFQRNRKYTISEDILWKFTSHDVPNRPENILQCPSL